ncbi:voltage-gated hydrogen channel 1 isoform X2 [Ursus arctos]|uniref:voltage-gated hydrogen channel 1 isoform X2 n=1 Tax=Ursus arctos TaxID=9644 RepID=UPI0025493FC5|nr:voltage-gated hydrogen channel 1 isoform X2 [Ursus arctos]XP_057161702.1 voltage-gated hydrogen channel 1 isoform X2 [Ursus arctos]XP_057161703.1 voltage-gated hydrogen channel 1 isoform X2 [Ursus arctos]
MATWDEKASSRRAKVAPAKRMSKFLKHFTVVGDDYHAWNINYKKWENEEDDEEEEQTPQAPASGEEGRGPDPVADPVPVPRPPLDFRATLRKLFSSHRFQVIIICLVILDALLVLAELILDLKIIELDKNDYAAMVFHYMSFAILTFFMMEIFFKLFVFRMEFFHHKFEILDAIVVVVSFILDFVLLFRKHQFEALGLLILLRLWRVARIINGIIISVKTRSERQLLRLKQMNIQLAAKIQHLEFSCSEKVRRHFRKCHLSAFSPVLLPARPSLGHCPWLGFPCPFRLGIASFPRAMPGPSTGYVGRLHQERCVHSALRSWGLLNNCHIPGEAQKVN